MKKITKTSLFKFLLLVIIISIENSPTYGQKASVYHQNPVLGFIDGKQVTFEDVRNKKTNYLSLQLYQQLRVRLMDYSIKKLAKKHSECCPPTFNLYFRRDSFVSLNSNFALLKIIDK